MFLTAAAAAALAGCDATTSPHVAGVASGTTANVTEALIINPGQITLTAGTSVQLSTNAPTNLQNQVQWSSSNTTVATVSPTGTINAFAAGTSLITARYAFDTTRVATATVNVTGTRVP